MGATPSNSVYTTILDAQKKDPSLFQKVGSGEFMLHRTSAPPVLPASHPISVESPVTESDDASLIQAFGMYWDREKVDWNSKPKILGRQETATTTSDMATQIGVYVLYNGHTAIYVGRSVDRPIGLRLYEHTKDRLRARWDRFSWFGILAVSENGKLKESPLPQDSATWIQAIEAILIELMEPPLNRQSGERLKWGEYLQEEDPTFTRKREDEIIRKRFDR